MFGLRLGLCLVSVPLVVLRVSGAGNARILCAWKLWHASCSRNATV